MPAPATSAIPAAQDGLLAAIRTRPFLADITVDLGEPKSLTHTHLWIAGSVTEWTQRWAVTGLTTGTGRASREERFTIPVAIYVNAADFAAARTQAFLMLREVEEALRESFTLGSVVFDAEFTAGDAIHGRQDDGHVYAIDASVLVTAQIG